MDYSIAELYYRGCWALEGLMSKDSWGLTVFLKLAEDLNKIVTIRSTEVLARLLLSIFGSYLPNEQILH